MRKIFCNLLFIFLLLFLSAYSPTDKEEKKNVEITLFLDKDMTEVGQNVFVGLSYPGTNSGYGTLCMWLLIRIRLLCGPILLRVIVLWLSLTR